MAYRGYSDSDDVKPTEQGLMLDAEAINQFLSNIVNSEYPHLTKYVNQKYIFLQGRSLGGAVSIYMAT